MPENTLLFAEYNNEVDFEFIKNLKWVTNARGRLISVTYYARSFENKGAFLTHKICGVALLA